VQDSSSVKQAPGASDVDDRFARPRVAALTIELATIQRSDGAGAS
jgi:hypothetical protein